MRGWILDLYPGEPGEMVVWLKGEDGSAHRLVDAWTPSLFVAADDPQLLKGVAESSDVVAYSACSRFVQKYEKITDGSTSEVLEVAVRDAKKLVELARRIERAHPLGAVRIYNCDVPPAQSYLYELDLFPLALCDVSVGAAGLEWRLRDDAWRYDYETPPLRTLEVGLCASKSGRIARVGDRIGEVWVRGEGEPEGRRETIGGSGEGEKILRLVERVRELDPDVVLTKNGDTFLFPHLIERAEANGVAEELVMGRDPVVLARPERAGTSYFSYGRILFKPSSVKLYGRIHLDSGSSFSYAETGRDGLFELSRVCRQPLHTSSRASIGKALSSLQFYHATKRGVLIPWKPSLAERFKDRSELLVADRGGFIFEPHAGVYDGVGELDFSSLFPNIMLKKNISAETVRCACCPDSENVVPELEWRVCRKQGITPTTMNVIVTKRLEYKRRKKSSEGEARKRYDGRQGVLKWLGVTSFGYLGFNNAKFGRIDAHIAVCAWDRRILLDSMRIAERRGFRVVHGIVDSLWLKKEGADEAEYEALKEEIERETGFELSFEGIYKWIAFLNSRTDPRLAVQNRYFGSYRRRGVKVRGIEGRRHDTPVLFRACQDEVLAIMNETGSVAEVRASLPACWEVFAKYARVIQRREVPVEAMVFTKNISKDPKEYHRGTVEAGVVRMLLEEGAALHQGESIRYVITDYYARTMRAFPVEALDGERRYDTRRYVELLAEACATLTAPFDGRMSAEGLLDRLRHEQVAAFAG